MKWPTLPRFKGLRARFSGEKCCDNPGAGMWLDTKNIDYVHESWEWVCTNCKRISERSE